MNVHRVLTVCLILLLSSSGCDDRQSLGPLPAVSAASSGNGAGPAAPSATAAVAASYNRIDVSWQDNSSNESGFEVHRSTTGPSGAFALLATPGANVAAYSNLGLSGSTQYCYKVRAFRRMGINTSYSAFSNTTCATTLVPPGLAPPSGVHAAPQEGRWISVTWTENSTDETGFRIERSGSSGGPWTSVGTTGSNTTVFNDFQYSGVEQAVCYRVFAVNSLGDAQASNIPCTAVPAAPTNLAATLHGDGSFDLSWTDNSAVEDGFELLTSGGGGDRSVVATLPANATGYHGTGLTPDNTYWYEVRATKDGGSSDTSNSAAVVFATMPPTAPSSLGVSPRTSSSVYGSYLDQSTNETGFRVERSVDGGSSWVTAATAGTNEYTFWDDLLSAEQQVCYRVIAFNAVGHSAPSNTACTTPPAAPTGLTASGVDATTVDLAWADNSAVEDGYVVEIYDLYDFNRLYDSVLLEPNATSLRYQGLGGSDYWYAVAAVKDGGQSDVSILGYPSSSAGSSLLMHSPSRSPVLPLSNRLRGKP